MRGFALTWVITSGLLKYTDTYLGMITLLSLGIYFVPRTRKEKRIDHFLYFRKICGIREGRQLLFQRRATLSESACFLTLVSLF